MFKKLFYRYWYVFVLVAAVVGLGFASQGSLSKGALISRNVSKPVLSTYNNGATVSWKKFRSSTKFNGYAILMKKGSDFTNSDLAAGIRPVYAASNTTRYTFKDLDNGIYYFRVGVGAYSKGQFTWYGNFSASASVNVGNSVARPVAPGSSVARPLAPFNNTEYNGNPTSLTFSWAPVQNAVRYSLLTKWNNQKDYVLYPAQTDTTFYLSPTFLPEVNSDAIHLWKVRAYTGNNKYTDSQEMRFVVKNKSVVSGGLSAPVLMYPASGTTYNTNPNLSLQWQPVKGAVRYEIWARDDTEYNFQRIGDGTSSTSFMIQSSVFDTPIKSRTYYWLVRAYGADNKYVESRPNYFSIVAPYGGQNSRDQYSQDQYSRDQYSRTEYLSTPVLNSPTNKTLYNPNSNVLLQWQPVSGAVRYEILGKDEQASVFSPIGNKYKAYNGTLETTFTVPSNLLPVSTQDKTYYWKVRAYDANNNSLDSAINYFYVKGQTTSSPATPAPTLSAPELLSPSNSAKYTSVQDVTLKWKPVEGAGKYVVYGRNDEVENYSIIATVEKMNGTLGTSYNVPSQILPTNTKDKSFYWKVLAYDATGASKQSLVRSFSFDLPTISLVAPKLLSPANGAEQSYTVCSSEAIDFRWESVANAESYTLYLMDSNQKTKYFDTKKDTSYSWDASNIRWWGNSTTNLQWKVRAKAGEKYEDSELRNFILKEAWCDQDDY